MQRVCLTRLYEIRSSEGRIIGRAHSVWTLLDVQTRNMAVLNSERQAHLEERLAPKPDFPMKGMGKVRVKSEECVCERPVYFSDLDVNGHLNSVRTMDMVLDLLPTQLHKDLAIKRIDIAYAKESMIGEHLQCFMQAIENGAQIELRKPTGETMVRAQVEWGNTKSL